MIQRIIGKLSIEPEESPVGGRWYSCAETGGGFEYKVRPGELEAARYLTSDFLLDGSTMATFRLVMREGEAGREFEMIFALLPQCSARMRMPLSMLDQAKWRFEREGAWLKPMARGERVDPRKVETIILEVHRKIDEPVRFAMTDLAAVEDEPSLLQEPVLPQGKLLDELGQSKIHLWKGRTANADELIARLKKQAVGASEHLWPEGYSRWGGWSSRQVPGTGFFRTHHDGRRWWLVDPYGYVFWSTGPDCVVPGIDTSISGLETALAWIPGKDAPKARANDHEGAQVNFLAANFQRAFGGVWHDRWKRIVLSELRRIGFNTVANWSEWQIAAESRFPYVRHLSFKGGQAPIAYRDLPDVYHPDFKRDAAVFAGQLADTADDPALIGYFLMNEPTWGFSSECPAAGMLFTSESGPARDAFADYLLQKYGGDNELAAAWQLPVDIPAIRTGLFQAVLSEQAVADCEEFSSEMVGLFFTTLSKACRQIDTNHLNLGIRFHTVPPWWALKGMAEFDVFSMNCYRDRVPSEDHAEIAKLLEMPVMIGEWHFGALDAGLPGSGIGHVRTQEDRGRAYRYYLETAAADPNCVGVHYFTLYDQSAIGRFDGEAYQIGFYDTCHRPYDPICDAARKSHETMYSIAAGLDEPFDDPPEYLPKLFV